MYNIFTHFHSWMKTINHPDSRKQAGWCEDLLEMLDPVYCLMGELYNEKKIYAFCIGNASSCIINKLWEG